MVLSLANTRALRDPAPSWRWLVHMPLLLGRTMSTPDTFTKEVKLPLGHIKQISLPNYSFEPYQYVVNAHQLNAPGQTSALQASMTFYEDSLYTSYRYLQTWRYMVKGHDGLYGLPADYKYSIDCHLYDGVNSRIPKLSVKLIGCWPMTPDNMDLQQTDSAGVEFTCTFSVDHIETSTSVFSALEITDKVMPDPRISSDRSPSAEGITWNK